MVFDHDLIRETLLADLSRLRRARVHATLGETIEERHERLVPSVPTDLAELARHLPSRGSARRPRASLPLQPARG
jgi:hypothetical protein